MRTLPPLTLATILRGGYSHFILHIFLRNQKVVCSNENAKKLLQWDRSRLEFLELTDLREASYLTGSVCQSAKWAKTYFRWMPS